jgi:hydrogenase expression/formation protein HypD
MHCAFQTEKEKQVVFFGVGFETTAPAIALSVIQAKQLGLKNFFVLASHVLVPPAMEAILSDTTNEINAFLAAGHVCTIMGEKEYEPIAAKYHVPIIITGFEPVDLLQGILMAVKQLEAGDARVENQYSRMVRPEGNASAQQLMQQVFAPCDREWRGMGEIPSSGLEVNAGYSAFDARKKFSLPVIGSKENTECRAGDVLRGVLKPVQCEHFGKRCTPEHPLGAPMVSSEGACAAYFHYHQTAASK